MKKNCTSAPILLSGLAALGLREGLYRAAVDSRGLLTPLHPLEIALWALTGLTLLGVLLLIRGGREPDAFPRSVAGLGTLVLAAAVIAAGMNTVQTLPAVGALHRVFSWLAGAGLAGAAYFRWKGKPPVFGCHLAAAAFFAVHGVACYQSWSRDPQMMNYVFSLLGCICLAVFSYQQAAGELGIGSRKMRLFSGWMGIFLCCAAIARGGWLYAAGALWMLTCLPEGARP